MQASSWRLPNSSDYDPAWIDGNRFRQWIEGNIVVAPDQSLVNVLRGGRAHLGPLGGHRPRS